MGGIDKFLNSAERKGVITINKKKGTTKIKKIEWKTIEIDTEYYLKTGIKREIKKESPKNNEPKLTRREYQRAWYQANKHRWNLSPEEKEKRKEENRKKQLRKQMIYYYKNREEIRLKRKERYHRDKEKERKKYQENRQYYIDKSNKGRVVGKLKKETRQYFKNNIKPYIIKYASD